jgi:hypothetical protein
MTMRKGGGILPHFFFIVEGGTAFVEFYMNRISMVLHGLYFGVALEYLSVLCCSSVFLSGVWCLVCVFDFQKEMLRTGISSRGLEIIISFGCIKNSPRGSSVRGLFTCGNPDEHV